MAAAESWTTYDLILKRLICCKTTIMWLNLYTLQALNYTA